MNNFNRLEFHWLSQITLEEFIFQKEKNKIASLTLPRSNRGKNASIEIRLAPIQGQIVHRVVTLMQLDQFVW